MVNRIKYTLVADIVDYFKNVHKMSGPIECTSMVTRIAMNLGCLEMANLAYIEGVVPDLGLDHFLTHTSSTRNSINLYLCCVVARQFGYLTQAFDCTPLERVTPGFMAKTRCLLYVYPGSSCHTYSQKVNTENHCLYYINIITRDVVFTKKTISTLWSSSSRTHPSHWQSTRVSTRF
jgi:hypothetical protein